MSRPLWTEANFWSKIDKTPGCWLWSGALTHGGYGVHSWGGFGHPLRRVHRIMYELKVGPIPPDMTIDHLCEVKNCCNPDHLRVASSRENVLRSDTPASRNLAKTECLRGHPFDEANTMSQKNGRSCRECARIRARAYYYRSRGRSIPEPVDVYGP